MRHDLAPSSALHRVTRAFSAMFLSGAFLFAWAGVGSAGGVTIYTDDGAFGISGNGMYATWGRHYGGYPRMGGYHQYHRPSRRYYQQRHYRRRDFRDHEWRIPERDMRRPYWPERHRRHRY